MAEYTLQEYYDMLEKHDWSYYMAENSNTESYRKSENLSYKINRIRGQSIEHNELYIRYTNSRGGGCEKPKRPGQKEPSEEKK